MTEQDLQFEQLCAACGLEPEYHDIWGNRHQVSRASREVLLAAMGIAPDTDPATLAPPVLPAAVVTPASAPQVRLNLPDPDQDPGDGSDTGMGHRWRIRLEGGEEHHGAGIGALLELPGLPWGYHRLWVDLDDGSGLESVLIAHPDHCYLPPALAQGQRLWGPAVQLYGVRRDGDFGMGDFTGLVRVLEAFAGEGAATVGVNPLHSLYVFEPRHCSPYSPSSRLFLNTLYIDATSVPDFSESAEAQRLWASSSLQEELKRLRSAELVDYMGVFRARMTLLEVLWDNFRIRHIEGNTERAWRFWGFREQRGMALVRQTQFDALSEFWGSGWMQWPEEYRDPDSPAVAAWTEEHTGRVDFFAWLQWLADEQLSAAGRCSMDLGLGVGLYFDLALGVDANGAEAWANQDLFAFGASTGCPPDDFNLKGQDWGLPPVIPRRLQERAYQPWIDVLRANMRHAGAIRIDHVMSLMRLFWLPAGGMPADGAYVHYPFADLLGILALESQRNQTLVVGEDLGTVPDDVRAALSPMHVLSYRLLYFEKDGPSSFRQPQDYPAQALVAVTTHDLPTFHGWWAGTDLGTRTELDLFPSAEVEAAQYALREADRPALRSAFVSAGLLAPDAAEEDVAAVTAAAYAWLARTPAMLLMVQMEDILGELRQVNFPGTVTQYPNWRQRLAVAVENWRHQPGFGQITAVVREGRGLPPG